MAPSVVKYQSGDVVFVRSNGLFSRAIRFFERAIPGRRTARFSHVALMDVLPSGSIFLVDAQWPRVRYTRFAPRDCEMAIYRYMPMTSPQRSLVEMAGLKYVNMRYDGLKIAAHFLDWCIGGRFFFRRLAGMEPYPICSWLVASAYERIGVTFGEPLAALAPEDIFAHVASSPDWAPVNSFIV